MFENRNNMSNNKKVVEELGVPETYSLEFRLMNWPVQSFYAYDPNGHKLRKEPFVTIQDFKLFYDEWFKQFERKKLYVTENNKYIEISELQFYITFKFA